ncbi:filamentous hemagglutinin N-terminal domain-containing protein [Nostoc sp. KVJ3]|uniref:beta strand repeat-containing protein n=1 Tax=Nostoc sp. KVJ3 TaxID=457945 RepID=UPI002237E9B1|nr:filamentous hemagglutinin N-terminal domain-containing protein [Nostoc sp. KVJ3]MCW5313201.1 filamentous hemagglutinin N-terminal domain-containing protein [Nostoc sp. KVJ3]
MTIKYALHSCLHFGLAGLVSYLSANLFTAKIQAQQSNIVPDKTLGVESSQVIGNYQGQPIEVITGGATRQINLFHSFQEFNISKGRGAYFFSPSAEIQNILARVTGNNPSEILGRLGTFGNSSPNLFLINPNGIVFGKNASLDVQGSFVGTTANGVQFGNQGNFSATNPQAAPLLTVNPSALLFNQINQSGGIINQSQAPAGVNPIGVNVTGLRVPNGQSLLLVGGNINLDGGGLVANGGRVEVAGLAAPGNVGLNATRNALSLNVPNDVQLADVSVSNQAFISVFGAGGGDIAINARNFEMSNSFLYAGIGRGLGNSNTQAGDIKLSATGAISLKNSYVENSTFGIGNAGNIFIQTPDAVSLEYSSVFSNIEAGGIGKGGDINITSGSLSLKNKSQLQTFIRGADTNLNRPAGRGDAGNVNIDVDGAVNITGTINGSRSIIYSAVSPGSTGNGGNISIKSGSLLLNDLATLATSTAGTGNAGNIFIEASDSVSLVNGVMSSSIGAGAVGKGGNINITAGSLSLADNSQLLANIEDAANNLPGGRGNGGNVNINVRGNVTFANATPGIINGIQANVGKGAVGNGGKVAINADSLEIKNSSSIEARTYGKGDSDSIIINARDISLDSKDENTFFSNINNGVSFSGEGNAGDIQITTDTFKLTNGAYIISDSVGKGNAGNITVDAHDAINLDGFGTRKFNGSVFDSSTGLKSQLLTGGMGRGGDIQVTTGSLSVTNGAQIINGTDGHGNAGNITINARDNVTFAGFVSQEPLLNSQVSSTVGSNAFGNGGNIHITAGTLLFQNGGLIQGISSGQGNAGNIFLDAKNTITFEGIASSGLASNASTSAYKNGNAGNIQVKTGSLFLTNGGQISTAILGKGNAGNITIDARDAVKIDGAIGTGLTTILLFSGEGKGGDIQIKTGSLSVSNGGQVSSGTFGVGDAGNILINTTDDISITNSSTVGALTAGRGNAGNISVTAGGVISLDGLGSGISTQVFNGNSGLVTEGKGGNIDINARALSISNGAAFISSTYTKGDAGNIAINTTDDISIKNGSQIEAATYGQGNAGNVKVIAGGAVSLDGFASNGLVSAIATQVGTTGIGKAGDINLNAHSLSLSNGAVLSSSTFGNGNAGNIAIDTNDIFLANNSFINSTVAVGGIGKGGDIYVNTKTLALESGSQIGTSIFRQFGNFSGGRGKAGDIHINASDFVTLSGSGLLGFSSGLFTLTDRGASGDAGNITVTTDNFQVADGAIVNASTFNNSQSGDITINANTFKALNGGQVITNTRGAGNAGNIRLNVKDNITIAGSDPNFAQRLTRTAEGIKNTGSTDRVTDVITNEGAVSGIFANTTVGSTGQGGSIFIDPPNITLRDAAKVSVNSEGTGNAGNITIEAGTLTIDNKAAISAQTASSEGGNINLIAQNYLLLRNGSQISTTAGTAQAGGDGGNINIDAKFIIAIPNENSDISANAFEGRGGNIRIDSQGIFGIEARTKPTEKSDITASSELGVAGVISVNVPDTSSIQNSFTELSPVIDTNTLIANSCIARGTKRQENSFTITGSGALTPNRPGVLVSTYTTGEVRGVETTSRPWKKGDPIIEPQGLYRLNNGQMLLSRECSN